MINLNEKILNSNQLNVNFKLHKISESIMRESFYRVFNTDEFILSSTINLNEFILTRNEIKITMNTYNIKTRSLGRVNANQLAWLNLSKIKF